MSLFRISLSCAAAAAALLPFPAVAQIALSGDQPVEVEGRLESSDPRDGAQRRYEEHDLTVAERGRYRISVVSDDFDPMVQVWGNEGVSLVAEDDDGGDGLNSRLSVTLDSGSYIVRVVSFLTEAEGSYRLAAERIAPLPAPLEVEPHGSGTTSWRIWEAELTDDDADVDGKRVDDYAITLTGNRETMIRVDSEAFDTVLSVFGENGREGEPIQMDDDSGPDFNSFLIFTPETTGRYIVRVTSFQENGRGAYRLRVGE